MRTTSGNAAASCTLNIRAQGMKTTNTAQGFCARQNTTHMFLRFQYTRKGCIWKCRVRPHLVGGQPVDHLLSLCGQGLPHGFATPGAPRACPLPPCNGLQQNMSNDVMTVSTCLPDGLSMPADMRCYDCFLLQLNAKTIMQSCLTPKA